MKSITPLFFLFIVSACCNKKDNGLFYVIKPTDITEDSGYVEPVFYSHDNFILYNDSVIYYHRIIPGPYSMCGTGLDHSKPTYLELKPYQLTEIPIEKLDAFWKNHIGNTKYRTKHVTITSPFDTIRNPAMLHLLKLSDFSRKIMLNRRKCTEEQLFASKAKFQHQPYSAYKMKWRIGFNTGGGPPIQKKLDFVPPVRER